MLIDLGSQKLGTREVDGKYLQFTVTKDQFMQYLCELHPVLSSLHDRDKSNKRNFIGYMRKSGIGQMRYENGAYHFTALNPATFDWNSMIGQEVGFTLK